jgi:hypothetical protein
MPERMCWSWEDGIFWAPARITYLGFRTQVRHEVAYVIVSPIDVDSKETCCSVNSSLLAHASLATAMCEAAGTM